MPVTAASAFSASNSNLAKTICIACVLFANFLALLSASTREVGNWARQSPIVSPAMRINPGLAYDLVRQKLVMFGGFGIPDFQNARVCCFGDTWSWNGQNWTQEFPAGSQPTPRTSPAIAYDSARNEMVMFGGQSPNGNLTDTWVYNGTIWIPCHDSAGWVVGNGVRLRASGSSNVRCGFGLQPDMDLERP